MGETTKAEKTATSFFGKLALAAVVLLLSFSVNAQGWEKVYGAGKTDEGQIVLQTLDLGYLAVGNSNSFGTDNDQDIYVVRTDVDGTLIWSKVYDEGIIENASAALEMENGSVVILGDIQQTVGAQPDIYLLQITKKGKEEWSSIIESDLEERASAFVQTSDGGFAIIGKSMNEAGDFDVLFLKVDENGQEVFRKTYQFFENMDLDEEGVGIVKIEGGYVFVANVENPNAAVDNDMMLVRIDELGTIIWEEQISTLYEGIYREDIAMDLLRTQNGEVVIAGVRGDTASFFDSKEAYVSRYTLDGDMVWEKVFGADLNEELLSIIELPNQELVAVGNVDVTESNTDVLLVRLSPDGEIIWERNLGRTFLSVESARDLALTKDGGFILTGFYGTISILGENLTLIKVDEQGNTLSSVISGRVFVDDGGTDCGYDIGEELLEGWLVEAKSADVTYFGTTDAIGRYQMTVDTGIYRVKIYPINEYWEACIEQYNSIAVTEFYDTTQNLNFPIFEGVACPYMEVDVSAPFAAICSDLTYTINYCNLGTAAAIDARIDVILDTEFTYADNSLGIMPTITDSLYSFPIGNISSNDCGSFQIFGSIPCDPDEPIINGQSVSVTAFAYPDTLCSPPDPNWDGAIIFPNGWCDTDSVKFSIKNLGADLNLGPDEDIHWIVTQDDVVLLEGDFDVLEADAELNIGLEKDGATYRLIAEQSPGYPGSKYPTVAIEGCADGDNEDYSTGFVTMFPEDDQESYISTDIQEIISSDDPILLRGYPKGYGESNAIMPNTDITYNLFFQNIGTDTIGRVVIRDTLSPNLDLTTVVPGASSHPCEFEVYDSGVLKITFSDITLLPGGSAEEASTYGFVKFRISQKLNNPLSTTIKNSAAVFFDYVAPQQSNEVSHTVSCYDLLNLNPEPEEMCLDTAVSTFIPELPKQPGVTIKVLPNPFSESTVIQLEGQSFKSLDFSLFDTMGRLIRREQHSGNEFVVTRGNLPSGVYIFKITSEGQLINSGKLLVR